MSKAGYQGRGKLLLTSEYGVLDGAVALAIPTRYGQTMQVKSTSKSDLYWKSFDAEKNEWFSAQISLYDFSAVKTTDETKAAYLEKLLKGAVRLNSEFLSKWKGSDVKTYLDFPQEWGLGTSSSLTYMVAQWAGVNPLLLHFKCFNGSGYDVACAGADLPITYQLADDTVNYTEVDFDPKFADKLHFIYLNKKQSSKTAIEYYFKNAKQKKTLVKKQSKITEDILSCGSLSKFIGLIQNHEAAVSEHLKLDTVTKLMGFEDFDGGIKSLGAWGGDFILAACDLPTDAVKAYFAAKGLDTVIPYSEMIFQPLVAEEAIAV